MDCLLDNPALFIMFQSPVDFSWRPRISDYTFNQLLLAQAKQEVLKLCQQTVVARESLWWQMMSWIISLQVQKAFQKWRRDTNYGSEKAVLQMIYTKMIQVISFLKMHCDLRRKLSGSSQSSDHRSCRITKECWLNPHILQVYRVRISGGCTWKLQL